MMDLILREDVEARSTFIDNSLNVYRNESESSMHNGLQDGCLLSSYNEQSVIELGFS